MSQTLSNPNPEKSGISDLKKNCQDRYVVPYANLWGIKVENEKGIEQLFPTKKEAVQQARKDAKLAAANLIIQKKNGEVEKCISYNSRKSGEEKIEVIKVIKKRSVSFN